MALQSGDTLLNGQYRILGQLGRGGFGHVYQADDNLLSDVVAIKELIPALVGDEGVLRRFLAEARATMRLAHDHIVRTHNVFREAGNYYIVMEYMAGGSLEARLQHQSVLPAGEAIRIAAEVCEGLSYAHQRGIVHCDLKPANILFAGDVKARDGAVAKVADFGIAHVSDQMLTRTWVTTDGFVAGTLPYMSPEQADGVRDDPRIDVYAVGAVLYRMLSGHTYLDFDQRDTPGAQADNVYLIRTQPPTPPSAYNRQLARLDGLVLKALAKRPEERFGSVAELRAALLSSAFSSPAPAVYQEQAEPPPIARVPEAEGPPSPRPRPVTSAPRPASLPRWFWPAFGGAVGVLAILVVVLILLAAGGMGRETPTPPATQIVVASPGSTATLPPVEPTATLPPVEPTATLPPVGPTGTAQPVGPTVTIKPTLPPSPTPIRQTGAYQILFSTKRAGNYDVYLMDMDGGNQRAVLESPQDEMVTDWSPVRGQLLYLYGPRRERELYAASLDGPELTALTRNRKNVAAGTWSPDGRTVIFTSNATTDARYRLFRLDPGTGWEQWLPTSGDSYGDMAATWAPDGTRFAFGLLRERWNLFLLDGDGTNLRQLVSDELGFEHESPRWSPDGLRLAFTRQATDGDHGEVCVYEFATGSWRRISPAGTVCLYPAWSPDGRWLAYNCDVGADTYLFLYDLQSDMQSQVTSRLTSGPDPWIDLAPVWIDW